MSVKRTDGTKSVDFHACGHLAYSSSTCSSDNPLVSYMQKYTNAMPRDFCQKGEGQGLRSDSQMMQKPPQMKNTLLPRFAFPGPGFTIYGVAYAIAQFRSQLEAVVMLRPRARALRGKISPVTTHAQGPLTKISHAGFFARDGFDLPRNKRRRRCRCRRRRSTPCCWIDRLGVRCQRKQQ